MNKLNSCFRKAVSTLLVAGLAVAALPNCTLAVQAQSGPTDLSAPGANQEATGKLRLRREPFQLSVESRGEGSLSGRKRASREGLNGRINESGLGSEAKSASQSPLRGQAQSIDPTVAAGLFSADQKAAFDTLPSSRLKGKAELELLANFDVEVIIDSSNSMGKRDCPGGLSRWQWCGQQARGLADGLSAYVPGGLTLTTFASGYDVWEGATASDVARVFQTGSLSRGTKLSRPLKERLDKHFGGKSSGRKPVLLAVITDGVPVPMTEPRLVADILVDATRKMKGPGDVTVVFLQVGANSFKGRRFLGLLDHQLVSYGAKYDCVTTVEFEELQRVGLSQSLVAALKRAPRKMRD
ncbi:MAG: hypothetical protein HY986_08440 [Candidatus Melainabacteria bacterium]|nr:hypothetical protein [Candidatus Melainabacteria bacterium]